MSGGGVTITAVLDSPEFLQEWAAWIAMRREHRWSTAAKCLSSQLAALEAVGRDAAIATIKHSLTYAYKGLFPEKFANGRTNGNGRGERTLSFGPGQVHSGEQPRGIGEM